MGGRGVIHVWSRSAVTMIVSVWTLLAIVSGCAKRSSERPEPKPVGASDPRIRAAAPHVQEWVGFWRAAIPEFRAESLYFSGSATALRGGFVQSLDSLPSTETQSITFGALGAESPDHRYKLIFDWYQSITDEGGDIEIGGEPDSAPLLLDLQRRVSNQFKSCGTPCGFHWGGWLSPREFMLAMWQELDAEGSRLQGSLEFYSITDSTVTSYVTRPVSREAFERYRGAWERWVADRYSALKGRALSGTDREHLRELARGKSRQRAEPHGPARVDHDRIRIVQRVSTTLCVFS